MKKAHYLQHVHFEGLGSIEAWLKKNDYTISATRFYEDDRLPDPESVDLVIIMGGPMSVNDTVQYPWIETEIDFIKQCIALNTPMIGICLGAQLIASALGARVYPNSVKEIGWFNIHRNECDHALSRLFESTPLVFHWHGETFDLPDDSILLASTRTCRHQAFLYGQKVLGLQFHLETTPDSAQAIVNQCAHELVDGPFIQDQKAILSQPQATFDEINRLMGKVLDVITQTDV